MQEGGDARLDTSLETLLERAPRDGSARVLATVVATVGSTYRKPGARMLIMADGSYFGLLSGGCQGCLPKRAIWCVFLWITFAGAVSGMASYAGENPIGDPLARISGCLYWSP